MERYYDGDQEALFKAAHVINPYVKPKRESKVMTEVETRMTFAHLDARLRFARGKFFLDDRSMIFRKNFSRPRDSRVV